MLQSQPRLRQKNTVGINKDVISKRLEGLSVRARGRKLGVSVGTLRKLLEGKPVTVHVAEHVAKRLEVDVSTLIQHDTTSAIPSDPTFFESLRYGWYIDNDRKGSGEECWIKERLDWEGTETSSGQLFLVYRLKNAYDDDYAVRAVCRSETHFAMYATKKDGSTSFDSSFHLCVDGVLCGIWTGLNHFDHITTYRTLFSTEPLSFDRVQELAKRVRLHSSQLPTKRIEGKL